MKLPNVVLKKKMQKHYIYTYKLQQQKTRKQNTRKMESHKNKKHYDLKQIDRHYTKNKSCYEK